MTAAAMMTVEHLLSCITQDARRADPAFTTLHQGVRSAVAAADETTLPQTVVRDPEWSGGWWFAESTGRLVREAPERFCTILPARWFT